jgi:hypothetical protein
MGSAASSHQDDWGWRWSSRGGVAEVERPGPEAEWPGQSGKGEPPSPVQTKPPPPSACYSCRCPRRHPCRPVLWAAAPVPSSIPVDALRSEQRRGREEVWESSRRWERVGLAGVGGAGRCGDDEERWRNETAMNIKVHFWWSVGNSKEQVLYFKAHVYIFHGLALLFGYSPS